MNFSEHVRVLLPSSNRQMAGEALAELEYGDELRIKQQALATFWREQRLPGTPSAILPSPLPRRYRTTTKRRVFFEFGQATLDFSDLAAGGGCAASELEPAEHQEIYAALHAKLNQPAFSALAKALNWIIVRGNYKFRVVVFNVSQLDATVVRKLKQLAAVLQQLPCNVTAAHMYYDPTRSDYYLESMRPEDGLQFKQLYGPAHLVLDRGDYRLKYPVTGFSQVNESMVEPMVARAKALLAPSLKHRLLDLYCGYGLFSFGLGQDAASSLGVEWEGPSIAAAKESAKYLHRSKAQFMAGRIDADFVANRLPPVQGPEVILLDPPRKGTEPGVIEALAARHPDRVLHIFCGTDEIPRELSTWHQAGYAPVRIEPLDMFPGSAGLETLVLLEPMQLRDPSAPTFTERQARERAQRKGLVSPSQPYGQAQPDERKQSPKSGPRKSQGQNAEAQFKIRSPWDTGESKGKQRWKP